MDNNSKKNDIIRVTKLATMIFALIVITAIAIGWNNVPYITYVIARKSDNFSLVIIYIAYYIGTVLAGTIVFNMYRLLDNLSNNNVFVKKNISYMNIMSGCCLAIAIVCLSIAFVWTGTVYVAVVGIFMSLVVKCVASVMEKAIEMKSELDLTV